MGTDLLRILSLRRTSPAVLSFLSALDDSSSNDDPRISHVGGHTFSTHDSLGLSIESDERDRIIGLDITNSSLPDGDDDDSSRRRERRRAAPFVGYPILLPRRGRDGERFALAPETTGQDLLEAFGEPDRKGGGKMGLGIWVEWSIPFPLTDDADGEVDVEDGERVRGKAGWFVQWTGPGSAGPGAWDQGKTKRWGTVKVWWEQG